MRFQSIINFFVSFSPQKAWILIRNENPMPKLYFDYYFQLILRFVEYYTDKYSQKNVIQKFAPYLSNWLLELNFEFRNGRISTSLQLFDVFLKMTIGSLELIF